MPSLATVLVSNSVAASSPAEGAEGGEKQSLMMESSAGGKNNESNILSSSPNADRLSSIILTLLSHSKQPMRSTVITWIHHFVSASADARNWTFKTIITPLLLATDSNEDQAFLVTAFLGNLNEDESSVAEDVLAKLVDRFVEAVEGQQLGPVKATVESILILIKKLDCHSIAEVSRNAILY